MLLALSDAAYLRFWYILSGSPLLCYALFYSLIAPCCVVISAGSTPLMDKDAPGNLRKECDIQPFKKKLR